MPEISEDLRRRFDALSPREQQVLRGLMRGWSAHAIAAALHTSLPTTRTHIQAILHKVGVHSQLEAASLAYRAGWPSEPSMDSLASGAARPTDRLRSE
ncbi:MAG: response regulator transcription factor [Solirubrobacteraceae bacterium]